MAVDRLFRRSPGSLPALAMLLTLALAAAPAIASRPIDAPDERLVIQVSEDKQHEFRIHLAVSPSERSQGLMYVRKMPDDVGMLFVYERPTLISMWMKNTYIPLDMVFARADGSVSSVIHDTQPLSLSSQSSIEPVLFVLELNAGTARRLNIGRKSRIIREPGDD